MTAPLPLIGYVGIGLMGLPMATHLIANGCRIVGYDSAPSQSARAAAAGVAIRGSAAEVAAEVAAGAGLLLLNLPTSAAVADAMFGAAGAAATLRPPALVIDFSTIPVEDGRDYAARLQQQTGCGWIDAPVSGGPPAAGNGTLTVMAGGAADDLARAAPLLELVSRRCTPMGPVGSGLAAKMINQLIVGCTHAVLAEALVLAEATGIDAARIPECLAGGHADGTLLQLLYPRMAERRFAPQGYARQLLKDLEMVSALGAALRSPAPMAAQALSLYRMLVHLGHAELDTAAVVKLYDRAAP
ncbi:MAG: NAD(P)-dependent oxidoreductase [Lautropia sp.]